MHTQCGISNTTKSILMQGMGRCFLRGRRRGAQAVAVAIFLARRQLGKEEIRKYIEKNFRYHLQKLDDIRATYVFDSRASYSVPPAIEAFLFCAMVLFFAHKSTELLKTKLMKLLNYSDMIFYKENGISISGARYAHLPYGPVPENFDILLGTMAAEHLAHIEVFYDNGYEKH